MSSEYNHKDRYLYKHIVNESSKTAFKRRLRETFWDSVKDLDHPNDSYMDYKRHWIAQSWITKGIAKSSKRQ